MRTRFCAFKMAILATVTTCGIAGQAFSAGAQAETPPGGRRHVSPALNAGADLTAFVERLAQRYQVQIVVDPDLEVPNALPKAEEGAVLATVLDRLSRQWKNTAWQRVYRQRDVALPSPAKLAALARALDHLPQTDLGMENPQKARGGALWLAQPRRRGPEMQGEGGGLLDTKPVYLLYNTALPADGRTVAERVMDSQQQQLKLIAQLRPEQRPNPARLGMQVLQGLGGAGGEGALRALGEAGMAAWQNTAPEMRDAMMQQFMQTAQNSPPLEYDPAADPGAGATPPRNYIETLRDIAALLAKQYQVRILIDPALNVPTLPRRPGKELNLAQALDALLQSVPDSAWRPVHLKAPTPASAPLTTRSLIATARVLDHAPAGLLQFESAVTRRSVTLQTDLTAAELSPLLTTRGLTARPVTYLLYATQGETDGSLSVAQRLAQMQRQQMEQLLSLNTDQMNQVITQALAQYSGGAGDSSTQMMRLPVMGLLMGTWFPRKAKEQHAGDAP